MKNQRIQHTCYRTRIKKITINRNHIVPNYPKEKHIKEELNNYLFDKNVPTLKQPEKNINKEKPHGSYTRNQKKPEENSPYNLRKKIQNKFKIKKINSKQIIN